jgi:cysteine desulfurase
MDSGIPAEAGKARVYLDWNATAPLKAAARAAVLEAFDRFGNPSSIHAEGRAARAIVEEAREAVAGLVGARPQDVTFTSGGTEANVMALTPQVIWPGGRGCARLLASAVEHPSVLAGGQFAPERVDLVPVTPDGMVALSGLKECLQALSATGEKPLVSVMLANNETGVVQPVAEVAEEVHRCGGLLHVDAVQAAGRMPIDIKSLGADLMTVSGHKLGSPKGVGALVRASDAIQVTPLIRGGGQERRARAGTENVAAIAGMAAAIRETLAGFATAQPHLLELRERLEAGIAAVSPRATVFGAGVERLSNTTLFAVPGIAAETALIAFDLDGIAVSSGSACSSGKVAPSHVLAAMGVGRELALGAIRASYGPTTTTNDIDRLLKSWRTMVARLDKTSQKGRGGVAA